MLLRMDDLRRPWDCLDIVPWGSLVAIAGNGVRWLVVDYTEDGLLRLARPLPAPRFVQTPIGMLPELESLGAVHQTAVVVLRRGWSWRPPAPS